MTDLEEHFGEPGVPAAEGESWGEVAERLRNADQYPLDPTELPVLPKVSVDPDEIGQPRRVEFGHMTQVRGTLRDDRVKIVRQGRMHRFGHGMSDHGPSVPLFRGNLQKAIAVYRALDALLAGGDMEVDDAE